MSSQGILITACLLAFTMAACSSRPIYAPVSSRSHDVHPRSGSSSTSSSSATSSTSASASASAITTPAKVVRKYPASGAASYVVRPGDTLASIARQHGMAYGQLASINGLRSPFTIHEGQRLRLRGEARAAVVTAPLPKAVKVTPKSAPEAITEEMDQSATAKAAAVVRFDGQWQWPTRGRLLRGYKPDEPGKKGIYIGGHSGQPVKAAASGKVVYVGSGLVGYGRLIIVKHNEILLSTYGHNSELLVAEGEYVKTGQVIAKMGSSTTGRNELYFEIRKEGKPVNPLAYLPKQN